MAAGSIGRRNTGASGVVANGDSFDRQTGAIAQECTLTASVSHDTTGTGVGGAVSWNYQVSESVVHALSTDAVDNFIVTLDDGHGGFVPVNLSIALLPHDVLL